MRSELKNVKGLGTEGNGFHHWWMQRITAILLLLLSIWFISKIFVIFFSNDNLNHLFNYKFSLISFVLFLIIALFHSTLGIKVVIEDYVHRNVTKFILIISTQFLAFLTSVFLVFWLITFLTN